MAVRAYELEERSGAALQLVPPPRRRERRRSKRQWLAITVVSMAVPFTVAVIVVGVLN